MSRADHRGGTSRHRRAAGAQVRHRLRERIDEAVQIEERFDFLAREDEHRARFWLAPARDGKIVSDVRAVIVRT